MTYFEELCADGMFEELGYEKYESSKNVAYVKDIECVTTTIDFDLISKEIEIDRYDGANNDYYSIIFNMKELQAINKKCVELCWLKERD